MPLRLRHVLKQSGRVGMETGSPADSLITSCLCAPWGVFVYPRVGVGLPVLKNSFLKDAKMVLAVISDKVPIYAGGVGLFKEWFGESIVGKSEKVNLSLGGR